VIKYTGQGSTLHIGVKPLEANYALHGSDAHVATCVVCGKFEVYEDGNRPVRLLGESTHIV